MTTTSTVSSISAGLSWLLPIALVGQALGQCSVNVFLAVACPMPMAQ